MGKRQSVPSESRSRCQAYIAAYRSIRINIKGSFGYGSDHQTAVDLLAMNRISIKELITNKVKLDDAEEAFRYVKVWKETKV
jgi:D-xylulose reductase